jgi:multiple RNA-binding domain-containing protein 1
MSSRLIVRNLPKHLTDARFKMHFEQKGEVTDIHVMKTKDGRSRRFGFVGFKTAAEAKGAKAHFNGTYMDTSRIEIEFAVRAGDSALSRPWSRYSEGSSRQQAEAQKSLPKVDLENKTKAEEGQRGFGAAQRRKEERNKTVTLNLTDNNSETAKLLKQVNKDDPKFAEFLEAYAPRNNGSVWDNADMAQISGAKKLTLANVQSKKPGGESAPPLKKMHVQFADEDDTDDEEYQEPAVIVPDAQHEEAEPDKESLAFDEAVDDLAWLKSKKGSKSMVSKVPADKSAASGDPREVETPDASTVDSVPVTSSTVTASTSTKRKRAEGHQSKVPTGKGRVFVVEESDDEDTIDEDSSGTETNSDMPPSTGADSKTTGGSVNPWAVLKSDQPAGAERLNAATVSDEDVSDTGRLFVRNLPFVASEEEISDFFKKWGDLAEVHVPRDRDTKASKGVAYVMYSLPQQAVSALAEADGAIFQGRLIHAMAAKPRPVQKDKESESHKASFKQQKQDKERSMGDSDYNWNSLFMGSNSVADAMTARLGVEKAAMLGREAEGGSMAVRLALGETQILNETRQVLGDEGVSIDANSSSANGGKVERSQTAILIKNIPFNTTEQELVELFEAAAGGGSVDRVVLPPSRTLALVEYVEATDAKRGFRALAYKKFKQVPLFLEWAPVGAQDAARNAKPGRNPRAAGDKEAEGVQQAEKASDETTEVDEDDEGESQLRIVFVKNLNFKTTEDSLRKVMQLRRSGPHHIRSVTIPKKSAKGNSSVKLSMGYGFVEYMTAEDAHQAVRQLRGVKCDEHDLEVSLSTKLQSAPAKGSKANTAAKGVKPTSKLLVRNVPFEATKKELRELFGTFGQLKSVRIPRKFDHTHRGFAFVEFLTKQEAQTAFEALAHTHFYGRHLVLEYAKAEESLDELRAKTKRKYDAGEAALQKSHSNADPSKKAGLIEFDI